MNPNSSSANPHSKIRAVRLILLFILAIKKKLKYFLGVYEKNTIVNPADFKISPPSIDELKDKGKNKRFKLTVDFTLPEGSYGTVVTKRIFNN